MIPLEVLDHIGRHCPRALNTYILCLARLEDAQEITFSKHEIMNDLSESYCKFKNDLKALAREGLLEWHEMNGNLHVIIADNEFTEGEYDGV